MPNPTKTTVADPAVEEDRDVKFALAQLRHLYALMVQSCVKDTAEAARGMLGPSIARLETAESRAERAEALLREARDAICRTLPWLQPYYDQLLDRDDPGAQESEPRVLRCMTEGYEIAARIDAHLSESKEPT